MLRHLPRRSGMRGSFDDKLGELERRILDGPGALDPQIRRQASDGRPLEAVASFAGKVRLHAYEVTDADVQELLASGYSEDQVFELTVAAAYGAARRRLDVGVRALAARPDEAGSHSGRSGA
jgi:alkylhydroperoxidase family enzyme